MCNRDWIKNTRFKNYKNKSMKLSKRTQFLRQVAKIMLGLIFQFFKLFKDINAKLNHFARESNKGNKYKTQSHCIGIRYFNNN